MSADVPARSDEYVEVMTAPLLDQRTADLLRTFNRPGGGDIRWNLDALDWSFGHPMFSPSSELLARVDRLLADGLIGFADPLPGSRVCDVTVTDAGREVLR